MSTKALQVIESHTGEVVRTIDVSGNSAAHVDRCEMGLLRQMNLDCYHVARVQAEGANQGAEGEKND